MTETEKANDFGKLTNPVAGLDVADDPEEDINVEEEENVG